MPKDSQPDSKEQEAKKKRCCCKKKTNEDGVNDDKIEEGPEFAVSGLAPEKKRCGCKKKS